MSRKLRLYASVLFLGFLISASGQEPAKSLPVKGSPDDFPLAKPQIASAVGRVAPDFSLPDAEHRAVKLSSFRGQKVLLIFYRGYW
jgi:cytochrome oxidase Cu insertion factor (SCO1/SenC/PrrC family)